jgi:GntR family transcriptional regulator, uxu operon transcriptional repressor
VARPNPPSPEPGERRRYLDVIEEIMRLMALAALKPGDRLPNERQLTNRCAVSRSTVREALLALELCGVIEVLPGSGCYLIGGGMAPRFPVGPVGESSPRELLDVRQMIEPTIARLCARSAGAGDVRRICQLIEEANAENDSPTAGNFQRFAALGLGFHRELGAVCGNAILTGIMGYLADPHAHPLWYLVDGIIARDADVRVKQVDEHGAILRAIGERDGDAAAEAMTSHLGAVSTRLFGPEVPLASVARTLRRR